VQKNLRTTLATTAAAALTGGLLAATSSAASAAASGLQGDAGALWHLPGAAGSFCSTTASTSFGPGALGLSTAYSAFGQEFVG
jgi:hypothetical protein